MKIEWKGWLQAIILILIYVMLGNSRSLEQNPFIPGAAIAVNMIVPVIAGILFGRKTGLFVGLFGTFINTLTPAGSVFELLAIIPHGIMGYSAGALKRRVASPIAALALTIGHALNILLFSLFGLMDLSAFSDPSFYYGLIYEVFIGIITIVIIITIARLGMKDNVTDNE